MLHNSDITMKLSHHLLPRKTCCVVCLFFFNKKNYFNILILACILSFLPPVFSSSACMQIPLCEIWKTSLYGVQSGCFFRLKIVSFNALEMFSYKPTIPANDFKQNNAPLKGASIQHLLKSSQYSIHFASAFF